MQPQLENAEEIAGPPENFMGLWLEYKSGMAGYLNTLLCTKLKILCKGGGIREIAGVKVALAISIIVTLQLKLFIG